MPSTQTHRGIATAMTIAPKVSLSTNSTNSTHSPTFILLLLLLRTFHHKAISEQSFVSNLSHIIWDLR